MNAADKTSEAPQFQDLDRNNLRYLWLFIIGLIVYFYWPCLSGQADWYVSDITYFFQPFSRFIHDEVMMGRFPLWNPYLYCGMPQMAMPSPGLFYPFSWIMFLLPFSAGMSVYMLVHQLIGALGAYLYLRDLKYSRCAGIFAAAAVSLCAYNFAFIRNCTLPASMAWLPISLYFERKIRDDKASRTLWYMLGLAFFVAMMMHTGRPEVGAPELLLLCLASIAKPAYILVTRSPEKINWKFPLFKFAAIGLGLALSLPTVIPGIEWTPLSPRAQGLALRWVLMWSANWYDFLSIILSQPMGNLMQLDDHSTKLRMLVLSRGGYLPFLSSVYLTPFPLTLAIWGLSDKSNRMRWISIALLAGFVFMAAGVYTPFAPFVVKLSPIFAAFRYPVKLMFFPCMLLILLAVRGIDLIMQDRLSLRMIKAVTIIWGLVFAVGIILVFVPQVGLIASKWRWLFTAPVSESILKEAQSLMARSVIQAALLGLSACVCAFLASVKKLSGKNCAIIITVLMSAALIQSSITYRQLTAGGFYEKPSMLAQRIQYYRSNPEPSESTPVLDADSMPLGDNSIKMPSGKEVLSHRILNLYFDPLTVPPGYKAGNHSTIDENFFAYSRDMLLYNSVQCWHLPASFAYEAAETGDYKSCFTEAFSKCSQAKKEKSTKNEKVSDAPVHRFAVLTATDYANTQVFRENATHLLPYLDPKYFQLIEESKKLNYRIYRVKHGRPRFYFTDKLVFVDKFKEFQSILCSTDDTQATQAQDQSSDLSYVLKGDFEKHKEEFNQVNTSILSHPKGSPSGQKSNVADAPNSAAQAADHNKCELTEDTGQKTSLNLVADAPKLLVIADHFYPGWVAELDGREVEILKANIVNRAILIPAGTHHLTMEYRPKSLLLGCSAAGLALILFFLAYWLFQKFDKSRKSEVSSTSNIQTA